MSSQTSPYLSHFPLELLKLIATHLPLPSVLSFSLVSTCFHAAVFNDSQVFRSLFLRTYDPPATSCAYPQIFKSRHALLRTLSRIPSPDLDLQIMRSMLLQASGGSDSANLAAICSRLPERFKEGLPLASGTATRLQEALELLLLPARKLSKPLLASTRASVYAPIQRFLLDTWKNLRLLNEIGLLFQHHLDADMGSQVFYQASMLAASEKPRWWEGSLLEPRGAGDLKPRWFGAYAYKHYQYFADDGEASLQETGDNFLSEIRLDWSDDGSRFKGKGKDFRGFEIHAGNLEAVGEIEGVPGWKKMTFVKDYGPYRWFYVGLMLPGQNIVIGRWGHADHVNNGAQDGLAMGNFMWWTVPEEALELGARDNRLSLRP